MPETKSKFDSLMYIVDRPEQVFVRGEGSWLFDDSGARYLDFIQGWAVNSLGHCPPEVVRAVQEQAALLLTPSPAFYNDKMCSLADRIVALSALDKIFFANSGAEANEGAIKLARKWGQLNKQGAYEIITMEHGFHGRTLATMAATGKPQWETLYEPKVPGFKKARLNDIESVNQLIGPKTVAIMLELIQGEGGVLEASEEFVVGLAKLASDNSLLLIFDEVQTGVGRTGRMFAYQHYGVEPDIMTLGKGLGSGLPIAALCSKRAIACFEAGDQGGTYNGNALACAGAAAVLDSVSAPGFLDSVVEKSELITRGLTRISTDCSLGTVRGKGLLLALDTAGIDATEIVAQAFRSRLLINAPNKATLRLMPSLRVTGSEIEEMINILGDIIRHFVSSRK